MGLYAFLTTETQQVWALERATGEPYYLEDGTGRAVNEWARSRLRCPFPDCVGPIIAIGGDLRRNHFRHLSDAVHGGGPESLHHVESKVMLSSWFTTNALAGTKVQIEAAVASTTRIADVLVETPGHRPLAIEIEYKSFTVADALAKHDDYEAAGVDCLWFIGHTRLRETYTADVVTVPAFAVALAAEGAHVAAVNPSTREVGTCLESLPAERYRWQGQQTSARVVVEPLTACTYRAVAPWLLTPERGRIEQEEEARRQEALAQAERERRRREEQQRMLAARRALPREPMTTQVPANAATYERTPDDNIFGVDPDVWKAAILAGCVDGKANWATFGWRDIRVALARRGIVVGRWRDQHFDTVRAFLEVLEREGWIFVVSGREFAASGKR